MFREHAYSSLCVFKEHVDNNPSVFREKKTLEWFPSVFSDTFVNHEAFSRMTIKI
jgi:hypothetical protein